MPHRRDSVFIAQMVEADEAARGISGELQAAHPEIPWREMIGMRNAVVHDYADVDMKLVWQKVRDDLPGLIERLNANLEEGCVY
jgi:uncharacterized protein with HEPN domain